jgi:dienelactone hydrolase
MQRYRQILRLVLFSLIGLESLQCQAPSPQPVHLDAPSATQHPASTQDFERWRSQIRQALFISDPLPALTQQSYGSFSPTPGVIAERVTYGTSHGMRVPAIVYRPAKGGKHRPGLVIVNGHSGDKSSWYAFYSGVMYARAGAVVVTYDPVGEYERNSERNSDTKAHDTFVPGPQMPQRMGGQMITDIMQAVGYLAQRADVDPARIAVAGYSMGSFHAAIAGALDSRIHALILSGGGNLDGPGGYWDSSSKVMCQAGPYHALDFLPDRGAVLYALNQRRGPTLVINGTVDPLVVVPHTLEPFFEDLRNRTAAFTGTRTGLFETYWIPDAGHRPNFVTRPAALWLNDQLHLPNWSDATIRSFGEVHVSEWAAATGAQIGKGFQKEVSEGGVRALAADVPNVPRDQLQAVPLDQWQRHKDDFVWEAWVERAKSASAGQSGRQ